MPRDQSQPTVAVDDLPVAAAVIDVDDVVVHANPALDALVDSGGRPVVDLFAASRRQRVKSFLEAPTGSHTTVLLARDGPQACELRCVPVSGSTNRALYFISPAGEDLLDEVVSSAYDVVGKGLIVGDGTHLLYVSETAAKLFGRPASDLLTLGSVFPLFTQAEQERLLHETRERGATGGVVETVIARPDGTELPVELWNRAVVDGSKVRTVTVIADDSTRRERHAALTRAANRDPLTGLANRRALVDQLGRASDRAKDDSSHAALVFIDLDRFKEVNDQHGHGAGDDVLRLTAQRLRSCLRDGDVAARIGGDEFIVLCAPAAEGAIAAMVERIRSTLDHPYRTGGREIRVGASVGATWFGGDDDVAEILGRADAAMYRDKRRRQDEAG